MKKYVFLAALAFLGPVLTAGTEPAMAKMAYDGLEVYGLHQKYQYEAQLFGDDVNSLKQLLERSPTVSEARQAQYICNSVGELTGKAKVLYGLGMYQYSKWSVQQAAFDYFLELIPLLGRMSTTCAGSEPDRIFSQLKIILPQVEAKVSSVFEALQMEIKK